MLPAWRLMPIDDLIQVEVYIGLFVVKFDVDVLLHLCADGPAITRKLDPWLMDLGYRACIRVAALALVGLPLAERVCTWKRFAILEHDLEPIFHFDRSPS